VVNRDHQLRDAEEGSGDLEMGLGSSEEKEVLDGRPLEKIDVRAGHSESPTAVGTASGSRDEEKEDVEAGLRPEGDVPPDGEELVSEWQEGHHRIIERRAGPGEEVLFVCHLSLLDAYLRNRLRSRSSATWTGTTSLLRIGGPRLSFTGSWRRSGLRRVC
jgi:hypothetical protein